MPEQTPDILARLRRDFDTFFADENARLETTRLAMQAEAGRFANTAPEEAGQ